MQDSIYQEVTDKIISLLEKGVNPWSKPWASAGGMPANFVTKKQYKGVNVFLLAFTPYKSPYWLSYKQATEKGGFVKKGEKSRMVVYYNFLKRVKDGQEVTSPIIRYSSVFNLEQTEGIKSPDAPTVSPEFSPISEAQKIADGMPNRPTISHHGFQACYSPLQDVVTMPEKIDFKGAEEYYSTLFHELIHSTGHSTRLAREGIVKFDKFGSDKYSREELIAEMGSSFLCAHAGILERTVENSASYLQGWLNKLKGDNKFLFKAASAAQKASDLILNVQVVAQPVENETQSIDSEQEIELATV